MASPEQKRDLLKPVIDLSSMEDLGNDSQLYHVLGPSNPLIGSLVDEMKWGGGRMFISTIFDYDEDDDYVENYFTGWCDQCNRKIRSRWNC